MFLVLFFCSLCFSSFFNTIPVYQLLFFFFFFFRLHFAIPFAFPSSKLQFHLSYLLFSDCVHASRFAFIFTFVKLANGKFAEGHLNNNNWKSFHSSFFSFHQTLSCSSFQSSSSVNRSGRKEIINFSMGKSVKGYCRELCTVYNIVWYCRVFLLVFCISSVPFPCSSPTGWKFNQQNQWKWYMFCALCTRTRHFFMIFCVWIKIRKKRRFCWWMCWNSEKKINLPNSHYNNTKVNPEKMRLECSNRRITYNKRNNK